MALQPDFDLWSWFYQHCNETLEEIISRVADGECTREFADKILFLKNHGPTWNSALSHYTREDWFFLNSLYRAFQEHTAIVGFNYDREPLAKPDLVRERMFRKITNVSPYEFSGGAGLFRCPGCKSFLFRNNTTSGFCEHCGLEIGE